MITTLLLPVPIHHLRWSAKATLAIVFQVVPVFNFSKTILLCYSCVGHVKRSTLYTSALAMNYIINRKHVLLLIYSSIYANKFTNLDILLQATYAIYIYIYIYTHTHKHTHTYKRNIIPQATHNNFRLLQQKRIFNISQFRR